MGSGWYSLAFSGDFFGFIGDFGYSMLAGVGDTANLALAPTIPHAAFMLFQGMFAVITPALMTGSFAERKRSTVWIAVMILWSLLVYSPIAHWVWSPDGWIRKMGALDFAGGMVVHMSAGFSALILASVLGKRRHNQQQAEESHRPYDVGMVVMGTSILLIGWFGFNAGSALSASGLAVHAAGTTFFAAASGMVTWIIIDLLRVGKASTVGACIGLVSGLVAITPAAGFVSFSASLFFGFAAGVVCNLGILWLKSHLWVDDALDVFGCHGMAGTLGTILTAVFASKGVNPAGADGLLFGDSSLVVPHLVGSLGVIAYSLVATWMITKIVAFFAPLRVDIESESTGLDIAQHDEVVTSLLYAKS